jgi:hypothetical protein
MTAGTGLPMLGSPILSPMPEPSSSESDSSYYSQDDGFFSRLLRPLPANLRVDADGRRLHRDRVKIQRE